MSPSPRAARRLPLALLCVVLAGPSFSVAPSATAQSPAEETVDLRLLDQPIWYGDSEDPLGIKLRLVNRAVVPLEGFLLTLAAHPVVSTRSGLHESFDGNAGATLSATFKSYTDDIGPGGSFEIELDDPLSSLTSLGSVTEGGVYPLTLTISDASGVREQDSLTTPLILYPEPPDVPLDLALVLPLNDIPSEGPDGIFRDPLGGPSPPLEAAVGESGWFTGLIEALGSDAGELPPLERTERVPRPGRKRPRLRQIEVPQRGLHLGIAPTPRFVEEIAHLADGYRRRAGDAFEDVPPDSPTAVAARDLLSRLRELLAEDGVQPMLVPYSFPDIPALARHGLERLEAELDEGTEVLAETLDLEISREWLFVPAGRIGAQSLDEIRFSDADTALHTIFHPDAFPGDTALPDEGCPQSFASFTCPVSVRTSQGPTTGLVGDEGLQDRFADLVHGSEDRLDLQNFFAETATIRQELPSIADRVVQVTVPSLWHPSPMLARRLLNGLREAPWLQTLTPAEAVEVQEPEPRSDEFIQAFGALAQEPAEELFTEIAETVDFLDDFRRMQPPQQLMDRLRRNTLVAQSRLWWPSEELLTAANDYLDGTLEQARGQIEKVTIAGPDEINLTSRTGEIPLVISNGTSFPTTVRVSVTSPQPDLVLEPDSIAPQQIAAEDTFQFTVDAEASSSGIFPIEITVETSDGSLELAFKKITIRSTEFNRIALGITVGAFAFLVLFYLLRVARRRREIAS